MDDTTEETTTDSVKKQLLKAVAEATSLTDRQVAVSTYHDFVRACWLDQPCGDE